MTGIGRKLTVLVIVLAVALAGYVLLGQTQQAPDIAGTDVHGKPFSLAALRGHPVLVDFWATSCPGCVEEMPRLAALYQQYHQSHGFELVAVAMNYDDAAAVSRFAAEHQLPFTVVVDSTGAMAHAFGEIKLTPTAWLISARGNIVQQYIGDPDFAALGQLIVSHAQG